MKKCPFCAEDIQDAAVKCRHCNEFLDPGAKPLGERRPWYFKTGTIVTAILCLLPLALPLVWFNPFYSRKTKIMTTLAVLALTWLIWWGMSQAMQSLGAYYKMML